MKRAMMLAICSIFMPLTAVAAVIHVPGDQPDIQSAIYAAADGDTVLVAGGTYTGSGNRNMNFGGKAITVKSAGNPEDCIIDCEADAADQHRGFSFLNGEGSDSVLEGFTIRNGFFYNGGGIGCVNASPSIIRCILTNNSAEYQGGAIYVEACSPTLIDCEFTHNQAAWGGGLLNLEADPSLTRCTFSFNVAVNQGGGMINGDGSRPILTNFLFQENSAQYGGGMKNYPYADNSPLLINCRFNENMAAHYGGGVDNYGTATFINCTFSGNRCFGGQNPAGGGIHNDGDAMLLNCLFSGNLVTNRGGGLFNRDGDPTLINCTFTGNTAGEAGGAIYDFHYDGTPHLENCILWGNAPQEIAANEDTPVVRFSDVAGGWPGEGNLDADPLFVSGPLGELYLSQYAAGQQEESPCVDAGNPDAAIIPVGTTRTDEVHDAVPLDMGWHYPAPRSARLVIGPGPASANPPLVCLLLPEQDAEPEYQFSAYGTQHYGCRVTCGDVDGDQRAEIITGAGPGQVLGPHVRGFGMDGTPLPELNFLAYGTNKWGVNVAAGDLDNDGFDEIITGAGPGAVFGPHVRGWDYDGTPGVSPVPGVSYFAYGTPKWGVNVATGDIDGDGYDEIISGAGPGAVYGPHVRGWNVDGTAASAMPAVSFLAYGTNRFGVEVTCGDLDGDGMDEIVTGPGPGGTFGSHVRGWNYDGQSVTALDGFSFFAWHPDQVRYGVKVFAGTDLNGDGKDELVVGCGPDPSVATPVKVYVYHAARVTEWFTLDAFPDGWTHGTNVAAGLF